MTRLFSFLLYLAINTSDRQGVRLDPGRRDLVTAIQTVMNAVPDKAPFTLDGCVGFTTFPIRPQRLLPKHFIQLLGVIDDVHYSDPISSFISFGIPSSHHRLIMVNFHNKKISVSFKQFLKAFLLIGLEEQHGAEIPL